MGLSLQGAPAAPAPAPQHPLAARERSRENTSENKRQKNSRENSNGSSRSVGGALCCCAFFVRYSVCERAPGLWLVLCVISCYRLLAFGGSSVAIIE